MEIIAPEISKSTMKEMKEFFLKTSIPRIIAKRTREIGGQINDEDKTNSYYCPSNSK
jgi:hypothetical protein